MIAELSLALTILSTRSPSPHRSPSTSRPFYADLTSAESLMLRITSTNRSA